MAGSIYGPGQADSALATRISTARDLPLSQQSQAAEFEAAEFEAAVFDAEEPVTAASLPRTTVENIVQMFCVSSLYREAFNSNEWGK